MTKKLTIVLLLFFVIVCPKVEGDTKKIEGTTNIEDAQIRSDLPENNYGEAIYINLVNNVSGAYRVVLIRVKNVASELGVGATNITAVCSLWCYTGVDENNDDISAYQVLKPWVEGDEVGVNNDDGDATWNDWASDAKEWGTAGCGCAGDDGEDNSQDGTCDASGRDRKSTAESTTGVTAWDHWYSWTISTELATAWYNGTAENGIVLVGSVEGESKSFRSTEYTDDPSLCPFFVFTYTSGEAPEQANKLLLKRQQRK